MQPPCPTAVPTCQDGFVRLELLPRHAQAAVGEARVLPQPAQLVCQAALGHLHHVHGVLAGDVDRVLHHAHLQGKGKRAQKHTLEMSAPSREVFICGAAEGKCRANPRALEQNCCVVNSVSISEASSVPCPNPALCSSRVSHITPDFLLDPKVTALCNLILTLLGDFLRKWNRIFRLLQTSYLT